MKRGKAPPPPPQVRARVMNRNTGYSMTKLFYEIEDACQWIAARKFEPTPITEIFIQDLRDDQRLRQRRHGNEGTSD